MILMPFMEYGILMDPDAIYGGNIGSIKMPFL
jgi:hypothetical protein